MPLRFLLSALAILLTGMLAAPDRAEASCRAPDLVSGTYENVDPATRSITAAQLQFVCGTRYEDRGDGIGVAISGGDVHWTVRLWGSCSPTDCDWGTVRGEDDSTGAIAAAYDQGFAHRNVTVIPVRAGLVRLVVTSYYTDGRPTRTWTETLRLR
ncbi:hypothetical protein HKCCE3408_05890 [Rhodobacterales bacterium HKCCE3408]|nr:hypothetical protein [Rhodobacterales bacterium HKCCE3408]